MIRWLAWLVTGAVAVGALVLNLSPYSVRPVSSTINPPGRLASTFNQDRQEEAGRLQFARVADSLSRRLSGARPEGGLLVESPAGIALRDSEEIHRSGATLLRDPGVPAGARLALFVIPRTAGRPDDAPVTIRGPAYLAGMDGDAPWCARIEGVPDQATAHGLRSVALGGTGPRSIFGVCAWVAEYGLPGPHVADWVARASDMAEPALDADRLLPRYDGFGLASPLDACQAGGMGFCRDLVLLPDREHKRAWPDWADPSAGEGRAGPRPMAFDGRLQSATPLNRGLLAALERDFGPERFQRFWSGDGPMSREFQAAFGQDPADWYQGRVVQILGPRRAGPAPSGGDLLATVLTVGLGLLGAGVAVRRRPLA